MRLLIVDDERAGLANVTAALLVLVALATTGSVILTGHSGAKAPWADQVTATNGVSEGGD
ncbi:conserved exported hypothetical protein [Nostocoides australiense Ben110]|uniref:Uncharacterized protein n=1 Tax=Nostocoides australiense Ben110 TaxID=1193182 RepID=W6JZI2_9MICO|nr:hypothetical protein [Tetrasphaera australiensis]CCH74125.1 conserved exported hypothetical protein [Tetrasphaera australiensis Ben110]